MNHPTVRHRLAVAPSLEIMAGLLSEENGPETPLIWFDGATGTGRSVLALGTESRFAEPGRAHEFLQGIAPLAGSKPSVPQGENPRAGDAPVRETAPSFAERPSGFAPQGTQLLDPRCGPGWAVHLSYEFGLELLASSPEHTPPGVWGSANQPLPEQGGSSHPSGNAPQPESASPVSAQAPGRFFGVAVRLQVVLEIDERTGEASLVAEHESDIQDWLLTHGNALHRASAPREDTSAQPVADHSVEQPTAIPRVRWRHSEARYEELIRACLGHIAAGNAYVLCLTNEATVEGSFDPLALYADLRRSGVTHHSGLMRVGGRALLSLSPERFVTVAGGYVESTPIKGTRPRGTGPSDDARLAEQLQRSEKERAENLMIVDLVRNDLSRVCHPESVRVTRFLEVETYPNVHQLVSTVRGRLAHGYGAGDALAALFPAGSMTGAPKQRATEILRELEAGPRGSYSGCFGYLSDTGDADFAMVIRSIFLEPGVARVGAGGGLTIDSLVGEESAEVRLKAQPLLRALTRAAGSQIWPSGHLSF